MSENETSDLFFETLGAMAGVRDFLWIYEGSTWKNNPNILASHKWPFKKKIKEI